MTHAMGLNGWRKESWSGRRGRRRSSLGEQTLAARTAAATTSEETSLTDCSLERPGTRDTTPFSLAREASSLSSHVDTTSYQEKLQGWSAVFHEAGALAPPQARHQPQLHEALPQAAAVPQRKYCVLPSIGGAPQGHLVLPRQHSNVETTLNQLDYARDSYQDNDARFFADLMELKREAAKSSTPFPTHANHHTLPPIQRLRDVVRPRTNIAELDEEDHYAFSGQTSPSAMSVLSDVEEFRRRTPDPDYTDTSP
ncbi:hypothetical protein ACOMHN_045868 [Nucella lapillus]